MSLATQSRRRRSATARTDNRAGWVLLAPSLVLFATFVLIPTVGGIALAFTRWDLFSAPEFAGVDNFRRLLSDGDAWQSLGVTLGYVCLGVIPTIVAAFLIAVLINVNKPGVGLLRVLYFVPVVISVAVSAVLWTYLYDPRHGPVGAVARVFGINAVGPLDSQEWALPALVLMMIWLALPIVVVLYLAGLQRVPPDIYSAAALDGAGPWRTIWSMTWPNVASTTGVVAVLQVINFSASSLDVSLIMTNGGPLGATRPLGLYAYQQAFVNADMGYASALSVLQLVVILVIVALGQQIIRKVRR